MSVRPFCLTLVTLLTQGCASFPLPGGMPSKENAYHNRVQTSAAEELRQALEDSGEIECRRVPMPGAGFVKERVCMAPAEWEEIDRQAEEAWRQGHR